MTENPLINEIVDNISDFAVEIQRGNSDVFEKTAMASFFWTISLTRIFRDLRSSSIFFEAGSTINFVARSFLQIITEDPHFIKQDGKLQIFCNGAIAKFRFDLRRIDPNFLEAVKYFPEPPFSPKYGKSLGPIDSVGKISAIDHSRGIPPLDEQHYRDQLSVLVSKQLPPDCILCLSLTGFSRELGYAPFTNSYRNFVFKDVLLSSPYTKVIFVDGSKWGATSSPDKIYEFKPLNEFLRDASGDPLAIIVSTAIKRKRDDIIELMTEAGLDFTEDQADRYSLLYFFNEAYQEKFGVFGGTT